MHSLLFASGSSSPIIYIEGPRSEEQGVQLFILDTK